MIMVELFIERLPACGTNKLGFPIKAVYEVLPTPVSLHAWGLILSFGLLN